MTICHLLLVIRRPDDASDSSVVSLHRAHLLECDRAENLDNVSMHSGEVMSSMRKAGLFASPDLELLDNSEVVDQNVEQSQLVSETGEDLVPVRVDADGEDLFGKVLPVFELVGEVIPNAYSLVKRRRGDQGLSDGNRQSRNWSRVEPALIAS